MPIFRRPVPPQVRKAEIGLVVGPAGKRSSLTAWPWSVERGPASSVTFLSYSRSKWFDSKYGDRRRRRQNEGVNYGSPDPSICITLTFQRPVSAAPSSPNQLAGSDSSSLVIREF